MRVRPLLRTLRAGDARGRLVALRSSRVALDVAITGAAVRTGLLQELRDPVDAATLAERHGWGNLSLVEAALQSFAAHGLVEEQDGRWRVARRGRRVLDDEVMRAAYEAFSGYHTELYRELDQCLTTGGNRRDIVDDGDLIARLSHFMDEFVCAELDRVTADHPPRRLLDVGCGAGAHLRHVLRASPATTAVGVEADAGAAAMARAALTADRLEVRGEIVEADVATYLRDSPDAVFDLVLLANAIYYVPHAERIAFLRALAGRLESGGRLVVVTTALGHDPFSRHFDLLLRAQADSAMELPDVGQLTAQLTSAGLAPGTPRRIAPGEPLTAVTATRP